ncbi:MAG: hypothetical protein WC460_05685 [Patescibacteria group bacterium]
MNKHFKFFSIVLAVLLMVLNTFTALPALAGGISVVSITLSNYTASAATNATIIFNPDGNINSGDGIKITFPAGYVISNVVNGDVAVTQTHTTTDITKGTASVSGQNLQIPITTEGDQVSGQITITISNNHITNPTAGSASFAITTWDLGADNAWGGSDTNADTQEDSGGAAIVVGLNQVNISATVEPTLTLSLSTSTCTLGTLSTTGLSTCSYDTEVSTNADSGYTAYIKADGNLRNATNSITNVADATVGVTNSGGVSTEEEYGISTTNASSTIVDNDSGSDCATLDGQLTTAMPGSALTTSDQSFATSSAPVSADSTTLCHAAVITGTTPAGAYAQTVTITVVGNF